MKHFGFRMSTLKDLLLVVFIQMLIEKAMSLECYKCANVTLTRGTPSLASLHEFMVRHYNPACGDLLTPRDIPKVVCPDNDDLSTYQCGYVRADLRLYAHKVGKVEFTTHIRDCIKVPKIAATGCYDNHAEVQTMVDSIVPSSVVSNIPKGKVCLCQGSDCDVTLTRDDLQETFCTTGDVKIGAACVDWWVFLMAGLDAFLVMFIITVCTCCMCPSCPFYFQPIQTARDAKALPLPPSILPSILEVPELKLPKLEVPKPEQPHPKFERSSSLGV